MSLSPARTHYQRTPLGNNGPQSFPDSFSLYDRGVITITEIEIRFFTCLTQVAHESQLTALCRHVPTEIQEHLSVKLSALAETDYYQRWFAMGDIRSTEQIHQDALDHQAALKQWGRISF